MIRKSKSKFLGIFFSIFLTKLSFALTVEQVDLLQKDYQLYQAWSLSRNYYFGNTYPIDRVKALAWQMVYVDLLPSTYPHKSDLLSFYLKSLSAAQIEEAKQKASAYRIRYHLFQPFSEEALSQAYVLRDLNHQWGSLSFETPPIASAGHFSEWIKWVAKQSGDDVAVSLDEKAAGLAKQKRFPIVYGQIIIKGIATPEMIQSNVSIDEHGYFVAQALSSAIYFKLPGYQTISIPIHRKQEVQPIPVVLLQESPHTPQTGVVGRVQPWKGIEYGNIILKHRLLSKERSLDPWQEPVVPLTVTHGGEFYATGLSPGVYDVLINTLGISTTVRFAVRKDEVRGLSLIDLRSKVHSR